MKIHGRMHWILPLISALAVCPAATAQQKSFTIEQVMSAPFPSDLVAAPAGGKVAWVFDAAGARNVWVAEPPDYKGRALTSYASDDGQDIAQLAWTPDARSVVYVRGGDFENLREAPNPRSFPQGVEQDIWVLSLAGGAPRKLAPGHSPAVSPNGDELAFIYQDQVWMVKLNGDPKPAQLIHARGKARALRWSPEGSKLAMVSLRDDHSFIGVYDAPTKSLHYLDPSVDYDFAPDWSPDGRQIAFVRLPAVSDAEAFGPRRTGQPWSIRVADVATTVGHEVWQARAGQGSVFRQLDADQQVFWTADDRLIFPWEGDGWTHLYSVAVRGRKATLMTPGNFEVEDAALTPDRREVVFNSNQDDTDRRHLWREAPDGTRPTRVTSGQGIEWSPVVLSDGQHIALLRSDARWPARPALVEGSQLRDLAREAIPKDFPAAQLVEPQPVIVSAADGLKLHGQTVSSPGRPRGRAASRRRLFPRRLAPADAARLALHAVLP